MASPLCSPRQRRQTRECAASREGVKLKVLHATRETTAERRYGLGRSTAQLLDGLRRIGVAADYFCASDLDAESLRRAESWGKWLGSRCPPGVRDLMFLIMRAWQVGRCAAQLAVDNGYTHVHCHDAVVATGARSVLATRGTAWGLSQHGFHSVARALHVYEQPLPFWLRCLIRLWERRTVAAADWVVCPTSLGQVQLGKELSLPVGRCWYDIPHAVPQLNLPPRAQAREGLGWHDSVRYLIAVGQLIPLKRFERIVEAMALLPSDWRLLLLGEGNPEPYRRLAAEHGLAEPIITSTDDVGPYLAAADAYVSASATESFGMATLEAMAAGLPIVCTDVGGVAEVVGDAAVLVAADCHDLPEQLRQLLGDPKRCASLAARARMRAANWPDLLSIAHRYHAIYLAASARRNRARPATMA